jgi:hypothetical protein
MMNDQKTKIKESLQEHITVLKERSQLPYPLKGEGL